VWPVASPSRWFPLSITADNRAQDLGRPVFPGLADEAAAFVRQVPDSHPSPVVSFTTVRVAIVRLPASRGSSLDEVPRQIAFVMRKVFPPRVQVRLWALHLVRGERGGNVLSRRAGGGRGRDARDHEQADCDDQ
jgi:hypothetical protein